MHVRDAMTTHVITISMDATLSEVQQVFEAAAFHHIVVTENGRAVGVLSDRDLLENLSPFVGKMSEQTRDIARLNRGVHLVLSRHLRTVPPVMTLGDGGDLIIRDRIGGLPVVGDGGRVVGILTIRDLARVTVEILKESGLDEAGLDEAA
jgi:acetoin utilization protein AcuB